MPRPHASLLTRIDYPPNLLPERLPKIALKWTPKQKRARGRPKKNWMEGIKKAMNERNLNEDQWEDRKQWSLDVGQRRKTFWMRRIHTYTYCRPHALYIWTFLATSEVYWLKPGLFPPKYFWYLTSVKHNPSWEANRFSSHHPTKKLRRPFDRSAISCLPNAC